jgi:hypothetical protein
MRSWRPQKLPKQRFHDLRHACISLLGAQRRSSKGDRGNRRAFRLTQNVYQHVYQEAKKEAAGKMDELLAKAVAPESSLATTVATKPTATSLN